MYSFPLLPHIYSTRKAGGKDFDVIFSPTKAQLSGGEKEKDLKTQLSQTIKLNSTQQINDLTVRESTWYSAQQRTEQPIYKVLWGTRAM